MKIIIFLVIAIAVIALVAVALKKNKSQKEEVDDLSPTKCKPDKKKSDEAN